MMIPLLLVVGMAFLGIKLGQASRKTEVRGELPETTHDESPRVRGPLEILELYERKKLTPESWLISAAVQEAYDKGNWQLAASIADRYPPDYVSGDRPPGSPPVTPTAGGDAASPPADGPPTIPALTSPFPKLDDEDWRAFVEVMVQGPVTFKGKHHIGCFHQRIDRIQALGFKPEELTTFEAQYEAFAKECVDHLTRYERVINASIAQPVMIKGTAYPLSISGLLALYKAAGPKNAMEWVHSKDQQDQFPNTTKLFLKTNGLF